MFVLAFGEGLDCVLHEEVGRAAVAAAIAAKTNGASVAAKERGFL